MWHVHARMPSRRPKDGLGLAPLAEGVVHLQTLWRQSSQGISAPGTLQVSYKIETLRVELYATRTDQLRLAMEVILLICIAYMVYVEGKGLYLVSWHVAECG